MNHSCYPFVNTPLPYEYDALEPYIDEKTMRLHHDKHLQTYIDNLNTVLRENPSLQKYSLEELLSNWCRLPAKVQLPVGNNAGGVYNHRFFFDGLGIPNRSLCCNGILMEINRQFQSFENFQAMFKETALGVFGSGYAWLVWERGMLKIVTSQNQNIPNIQMQCPILNLDVWEHAYYLKHFNVRAAYIDDWFEVIDWNKIEMRYQKIKKG